MILEAETSLMFAVRLRLMESLDLHADDIDIEIDDLAPAMVNQTYYCLSPFAGGPGRYSAQGDSITHNVFGCRVAVLERIGNVPRDRTRDTAFMSRLRSINMLLSAVSAVLRQDFTTINIANADLSQKNIDGHFCKPLHPQSVDQRPRMVTSDIYGAKATSTGGTPQVAMVRGINFGGAEYLEKN